MFVHVEPDARGGVLGRFLAQLAGSELPWQDNAATFREIAGIYVFERGAILDFYG